MSKASDRREHIIRYKVPSGCRIVSVIWPGPWRRGGFFLFSYCTSSVLSPLGSVLVFSSSLGSCCSAGFTCAFTCWWSALACECMCFSLCSGSRPLFPTPATSAFRRTDLFTQCDLFFQIKLKSWQSLLRNKGINKVRNEMWSNFCLRQ